MVSRVNHERAKQALHATNYKEFRLWLQVYLQMASPIKSSNYAWMGSAEIVRLLRDRRWHELVSRRFPYDLTETADQILKVVRQAIYAEYGCIERS